MLPTRRTILRGACGGGVAALAGCLGGVPRADGGSDDTPTDDTPTDDLPGSNGSDGGAGGTRPTGTGGPGIVIASVDDAPDLPVRPAVEVVRDTATADHPPRLRTTLTNATDETVRVGEGRAVHFEYVIDDAQQLILLPPGDDYPAEPDCWRLSEGIAVTEEYRTFEIAPDAPSTRLVDLYGRATGEDSCLPVGEYRFETTIAVVSAEGEQRQSARWGFSVLLE